MTPKWNNIALMSVISVVTIFLLAMPAMAYYNNDGWPVTTRVNGTINGNIFIDSEDNFQKSTTMNSNVPAGTVKYAYLYTGVWGGTEAYSGWVNVTFNGDHTSNGLGPIHLQGTSDTNSNVWCTGHGKYWIWYNVTNLTNAGQMNTATTSYINGSIDGRIYGIVLVVVLENQSEPMIRYWINDGSDGLNYNTPHDTGTTYFGGNVNTGSVVGSALTMIHLTGSLPNDGCLDFNGHPLSTGMISQYFELNTWDETNSNVKPANVTSSGNNVWYSRDGDPYINVCNAILVLKHEYEEDPLEFGDAPDNLSDPTDYPSLLASNGARHTQTTTECLGLNINGTDWKDFEPDANVPDMDLFDDGLLTSVLAANNSTQAVNVEVTNLIPGDQTLVLNILLDLNGDGDWDDVVGAQSEHVVQNQPIPLTGVADGTVTSTPFSTVGATPGQTWMRITLTRHQINPGWNGTMASAGYSNPFECGETEDWSVSIDAGAGGICGDVNDDGSVDMTDVMTLWYDIADYPYVDAYTISNAWAADVNCDGELDMTDVMTLWYDIADYPSVGAYEVNCC